MILPTIYSRSSEAALNLSGLLVIFIVVKLIKEIKMLNLKLNVVYVFFIVLFLAQPLVTAGVDISDLIYKGQEGIKTIRVMDNWIYFSEDSDKIIIDLHLDMKYYDRNIEPFNGYIKMPKALNEVYGDENVLIFKSMSLPDEGKFELTKQLELKPIQGKNHMNLNTIKKHFRNYKIMFSHENEKVLWYLKKF